MEIVQYSKDHWSVLSGWWVDHGWYPLPDNFLPDNGYLVFNEDKPVCAGFLYKTDSAICILEWIISDKKSEKEVRDKCLDFLVESLIGLAKKLGFLMIHTSIQHKLLINRMQRLGFTVCDENMSNLSLILGA